MAYKLLKSLYYSNKDEYAKEYKARYNSSTTVKTSFYIGENPAFFQQNADVLALAYEIAKLDKIIYKLCKGLPNEALRQYSIKCLIDEIVLTNKIEGVRSSRKEIGEALEILKSQSEHKKGKSNRFLGLVNKYQKLRESEDISLITCQDIRNLYDDAFLDEVINEDAQNRPDGKMFRKHSVSVYSETDKEIHTGISPEEKIIEAMNNALRFLNSDNIDELFKICVFHYFIEYIHPFYDGNGRLGRLILSYGIGHTLTSLIAYRISETIKEKIKTYYKAFHECNDPKNMGDVTPFLIMMLNMILGSMIELEYSLRERKSTWEKYEQSVKKYHNGKELLADLYSVLVQAALFSETGISSAELDEYLGCSSYKRLQLLKEVPEYLVKTRRVGHMNHYMINLDELDKIIMQEKNKK